MTDPGGHTSSGSEAVTRLLSRVSDGDSSAANDLLPLVYEELRARAGAYFRGMPAGQTLQPTALVHEAFLRLVNTPTSKWKDRSHFCAIAATAMRQILTDHARRRAAGARARGARAEVTEMLNPSSSNTLDVLAVDEALIKLAERNEERARLVEMRFFGGLSAEEIASVIDASPATVRREWRRARAWLKLELKGENAP